MVLRRVRARLLPLPDEAALHLGHHAQHGHEDRSGASLVEKAGSSTVRAVPLASKQLFAGCPTDGGFVQY
jgi:hypothetical protein